MMIFIVLPILDPISGLLMMLSVGIIPGFMKVSVLLKIEPK